MIFRKDEHTVITFNGKCKLDDVVFEEEVFNALKKFMLENFQNCEFSVSGPEKTLNFVYNRDDEIKKIEENKPKPIKEETQGMIG